MLFYNINIGMFSFQILSLGKSSCWWDIRIATFEGECCVKTSAIFNRFLLMNVRLIFPQHGGLWKNKVTSTSATPQPQRSRFLNVKNVRSDGICNNLNSIDFINLLIDRQIQNLFHNLRVEIARLRVCSVKPNIWRYEITLSILIGW